MNSKSFDLKKFVNTYMMELILLVICIVVAFTAEGFFTVSNLLGILRSSALKGVIAFGMTMVIICGEIDLSISSTVALAGIIAATVSGKLDGAGIMGLDGGIWAGMLMAFLFAGLIGFVNGFIRVKFNIPTFIITLAMMNVNYGLAAIISKGFPVTTVPSWYNIYLARVQWQVLFRFLRLF